jgi:hypothetical protein
MAYQLNFDHTISNSNTLTRVAGVHADNLIADVGLRIISRSKLDKLNGFDFSLFGPAIKVPEGGKFGISNRSADEIFLAVEVCRKKWVDHVLRRTHSLHAGDEGQPKFELPFEKRWNFNSEPEVLTEVGPHLAKAGDDLFKLLFERNCNADLQDLSRTLRYALISKCEYIAITSSDFFLPWGMLYTHPVAGEDLELDGSNWKKEGFWGYRYIIQQSPERIDLETRISPTAGEVPFSINFDTRLSQTLELPVIDQHLESIRGFGEKSCTKRTTKTELQKDFTAGRSNLERIIYFYCHGRGSRDASGVNLDETYLRMTDDTVSAFDFQLWAEEKKLPTSPLIFINACQGGQMTTMFYKTLAAELLGQGAVGLVGAHIDLPAVFAIEYAQRVFTKLFARGQDRVRLGPLLREVNRSLWDDHRNPLGPVYSLYRGVDCFIDWQAT